MSVSLNLSTLIIYIELIQFLTISCKFFLGLNFFCYPEHLTCIQCLPRECQQSVILIYIYKGL